MLTLAQQQRGGGTGGGGERGRQARLVTGACAPKRLQRAREGVSPGAIG